MMDVQIMRHIVDDTEQGVTPRVAQVAARRWYGPGSVDALSYVRSSANHIFRFEHEGQARFLRLAHAAERQASSITAELEFVQHVARAGLAVAHPIASMHGRLLERVSAGGHRYYAVVFEGLRGSQYELDELDEAQYRAWGRALAQVHRASRTVPPHTARSRSTWHGELRAALRTLPPREAVVAHVLTAGLRWLEALSLDSREVGLIHGDFELDNLVWEREQPQALDFDDATYAWYAVDFAAALQDVWLASDLTDPQRERRGALFMEGYAELCPLPDGLREAMPRLLTLVLALKVARVLRAYATTTDSTCPPWLASMRSRHRRWLEAKRAALAWD